VEKLGSLGDSLSKYGVGALARESRRGDGKRYSREVKKKRIDSY